MAAFGERGLLHFAGGGWEGDNRGVECRDPGLDGDLTRGDALKEGECLAGEEEEEECLPGDAAAASFDAAAASLALALKASASIGAAGGATIAALLPLALFLPSGASSDAAGGATAAPKPNKPLPNSPPPTAPPHASDPSVTCRFITRANSANSSCPSPRAVEEKGCGAGDLMLEDADQRFTEVFTEGVEQCPSSVRAQRARGACAHELKCL